MIKESNKIIINTNSEHAFAFLTNDNNLSLWVNGIVAVRPIGTHQNQVGDAVMIDVNIPKVMSIKSTLVEWQPPEQFTTAYEAGNMTGKMTYALQRTGQSTTVTFSAEHQPHGFLARLFSPVMGWVIKKERKQELQRLKQVLEDAEQP